MPTRRRFCALLLMALPLPPHAWALDPATGTVVLTITGRVRSPNAGANAVFDMAMLSKLPQHSFVTWTPWYPQPRKFSGPLLRDVLAAAGCEGSTVRATALNDYQVELPFDDARLHQVLVARLLDDKPMSVRDKGPLFLIYPFDSDPALRNAVYYSRAAWQLQSLEVI